MYVCFFPGFFSALEEAGGDAAGELGWDAEDICGRARWGVGA